MATLFSLRIRPNWAPSYSPAWQNVTATLDLSQLPSISVSAERGDVPLVASASDLSLTVSNAEGDWDAIFDAQKIIGELPPVGGETVRAPAAHFGEILLCRRATHLSQWQVLFYGFIDPISPLFDRATRTCTFTAYAPGKLLEAGNAERVHRFHAFVVARPFVIPVEATGRGAVQHPTNPAGDAALATEDSWWRLVGGAVVPVIPIQADDRFKVVRAIAVGGWSEGMLTVQIVDKEFTIAQVTALGPDLYFQTTEAVSDEALVLTGFIAGLELLNPWYRSRDWKALIDGSDGNTNCLANETNEALAVLGVSDTVNFIVGIAPELPLLTLAGELFAQPIYQPDVVPGCMGVSYARYSGTPILAHQRQDASGETPVSAKADILAPNSTLGGAFPKAATNVFAPTGTPVGYLAGPDDGKPVQLISSSINDQLASTDPPDYATDDLPLAGQSLHAFGLLEAGGVGYDSTHWCRAPSSYRSGSEPKYCYRLYARSRVDLVDGAGVGIQISRFSTSDGGATWATEASDSNFTSAALLAGGSYSPVPASSPSSRPSIKIFELAVGSFLYVWVNPFPTKATDILGDPIVVGANGGAFSYESATDDVDPATLNAQTAFLAAGATDSPILLSSAVHWPGATVFFSDRVDRSGVDVWIYSLGPTWTKGTIVDETGRGLGPNLFAADWINAVTDSSRDPTRLYVMVGKVLYAMRVALVGTELHISAWQAVQIDQVNYDVNVEAGSPSSVQNPNAVAWLTCPVVQAFPGEPDYAAASDALIVGTASAVYIVSSTASSIVDVADFEGLSVAAAIAKLIILRGYFVLTAADRDFIDDPSLYTPVPTVSFYSRLETATRKGILDLVALTETIEAGEWLQNYQTIQVQNSKLKIGPAFSSNVLTDLDGATFTIQMPRNAASVALSLDVPFLTTVSFGQVLANYYAIEYVIPRFAAKIVIRSPYAQGLGVVVLPGFLVRYLLIPPDGTNVKADRVGRVLTIDYGLDNALDSLAVA